MSDASSPQVRDHETGESRRRERTRERASEKARPRGAGRRDRPANERERDARGPSARAGPGEGGGQQRTVPGWEKIKRADEPRGGPYPRSFAFLPSPPPLPTSILALLVPLFFSLLGVVALASTLPPCLSLSFSLSHSRCPSRAYIIHISTLMFFDYVVRRSTFSPIFLRLLPYGRAPQQAAMCLAKLFEESCIVGRPVGRPARRFGMGYGDPVRLSAV